MHPLFGADIRSLARLLVRNGPIPMSKMPLALAVGFSAVGRSPITLAERGLVAWQRRQMAPMPAPIFVIGHWRSGTTHLYNLLTRADFGFVSPIAAGMPHEFLTLGRWLRPLLIRMLPKTRYVDQVAVREDSPQEDEIPLASMNPISFYHGIYFPQHFERHFKRSMFLEGCSRQDMETWRSALSHFIEKCWLDHGQRLIIKNPTYTSRIPHLLSLYPDARFIHIYRNPYEVFHSTKRFYRTLLEHFAWQSFDHLDLDHFVLEGYKHLMDQVECDKQAVADNRFIDLRFEDLEADPLTEIRRIYEQLELGDVATVLPAIQTYLQTLKGFQKTAFDPAIDEQALVERHWGLFLDRFGYHSQAL